MSEAARLPHPRIGFPPPLLHAAGLALGWGVDQWRPLPISAAGSPFRVAAGAAGVLVWLAIFLSALVAFRRHHTTLIPHKPAAALVTSGPYRFTRNPMYVSLAALYAGVTLLVNSWWPFVLLPFVILGIDRLVIAREEEYLAGAFPTEYGAYARRVRRWL